MPQSSGIPQLASHRRSNGSGKLRENRPQTPAGGPSASRRRRSRSPETRVAEEASTRSDLSSVRRKRKTSTTAPSISTSATGRSTRDSAISEDMIVDHIRRPKPRHRPQSQLSDDVELHSLDAQGRQGGKLRRRERSRSRETSHRHSVKTTSPEPSGDEVEDDERSYSGPIAAADYMRMKRELDNLKKHLQYSDKKMNKQSKEIDKLRKELSTAQRTNSDHCRHIESLRTQTTKSNELITSIESHMNCHICMDLLAKPFGLSPCGHVLCQACLQEWFRTAPPSEDDMYDDDAVESLVYRKKICPVCRTAVRSRPIPVFVVKSIASSLDKAKAGPGSPRRDPAHTEEDPWAGIFPRDGREDSDEYDEEDDDDDEDDEDLWSSDGYGSGEGYYTDDDDDAYQGPYIMPLWSPPTNSVFPMDFPFLDDITAEELSMLRRGATLPMINLFHMRYSHDTGLQVTVDGANIVHLGWNIDLHENDPAGEEYMDWTVRSIHQHPERWQVDDDVDGNWSAWKLLPADDVETYSTTESEAWIGDDEDDELDFL